MIALTRPVRWRVALWLSLALAVAALAAMPVIEALTGEGAVAAAVAGAGDITVTRASVANPDSFRAFQRAASRRVETALGNSAVAVAGFATAGPVTVAQIDGTPAQGAASSTMLDATFVDHLASHVEVLAGQLPAEGLGGGDVAVTMPQAGADRLGLHMSDRFCLAFVGAPAGGPGWCARVVGLWRPLDGADPIWGGRSPGGLLAVSQYDFYRLTPAHPPSAGLRYRLDPGTVDRDGLGVVAGRLADLRTQIGADRTLTLSTSLDRTLAGLEDRERVAAQTTQLLIGALAVLAVTLVAIVSGRFCDLHADELSALRSSGWLPPEMGRRLTRRLSWLAWLAMPAGLLAAALGVAVVAGPYGADFGWLRTFDIAGAAAILVAGLVAIWWTLRAVARKVAAEDPGPDRLAGPPPGRRRGHIRLALALLVAGVVALVGTRLAGPGFRPPWPPLAIIPGLAPIAALTLLCAAVAEWLPSTAGVPKRQRRELAGTLAGLQLERRPDQHALPTFLVTVAVAAGGVAAGAAAFLAGNQVTQPVPYASLSVVVPVCLVGVVAIGLVGYGLHFVAVARHRVWEYSAVFSPSPTPHTIGDSVATEQMVVLRVAIPAGFVIGTALTIAIRLGATLPLAHLATGVGAVALVALACLAASTLAGRPARRPKHVGQ